MNKSEELKKLLAYKNDPQFALFQAIQDLATKVSSANTSGPVELKAYKGEKGDKGDKGDKGEKGDKGDSGKDAFLTERDILRVIREVAQQTPAGSDGRDGKDGKNGKDGRDGRDGRDGTEITSSEIVSKLNEMKSSLDPQVINGLIEFVVAELKNPKSKFRLGTEHIYNMPAKGFLDQRWHGGGAIKVRDEGVAISDNSASVLDFIGAGVTVSYVNGVAIVNIPGGAGTPANNETPAGTIDGNNVTFTLAHTPINSSLMLYINGQLQTNPENYTLAGDTITFVNDSQPRTTQTLKAFYEY